MTDASNLLLTGASGVGKSTLLKRVGLAMEGRRVMGFYSDVVFEGGQRTGWHLDAFDGSEGGSSSTGLSGLNAGLAGTVWTSRYSRGWSSRRWRWTGASTSTWWTR